MDKAASSQLKLSLALEKLSSRGHDIYSYGLPLDVLPPPPAAAKRPAPSTNEPPKKQINFEPIWKQQVTPSSGAWIENAYHERSSNPEETRRRLERSGRFQGDAAAAAASASGAAEGPEAWLPKMDDLKRAAGGGPVLGTSQRLEKAYMRLHEAPRLDEVRPPQVLRKALDHVKRLWVEEGDYHYVGEQLKAIRQDLTVQEVRDRLTVEVYEMHGRIAIEVRK
jgi:SAC3 family protein LENG8/THP3